MHALPKPDSPSGCIVQAIVRAMLNPEAPPADYRRLRALNLKRAATCCGRPSLRPA